MCLLIAGLVAVTCLESTLALPQSQPTQTSNQAELASHDTEPTFRLRSERNLVVVRVVVRDSKGKVIGSLTRDDFRVFDNGKPQVLSHFSVEGAKAVQPSAATSAPTHSAEGGEEGAPGEDVSTPRRFVALFFDDIHLEMDNMMQVQLAADKFLANSVLPDDRIGVYTASGRGQLEFTSDLEKVRAAISRIIPHPIVEQRDDACPDVLDYQAYQIVEQRDAFAINIAYQEYYHCNCEKFEGNNNVTALQQCEQQGASAVDASAEQELNIYHTNTEAVLRSLQQTIRRLTVFPGQRAVVLVSPGFLTRGFEVELDQIADRAIHANVAVNSIDAKGLYAPLPGGDDMSKAPIIVPRHADVMGQKEQIRLDRVLAIAVPLEDLAADTGGVYFHNNNDLEEGFRRSGALPEIYYVLAFSPTSLKSDGRFHSLKVKLAQSSGLSVQSRKGYFAPSGSTDPAVKAQQEVDEAVFSQDVLSELPIDVHTQFFRADATNAKLSVLTHVNIGHLRFRKQEDRNLNNLTLVTALFDHNGQIVKSQEKTLEMRLRDSTLAHFSQTGITIKAVFDVKPGTYLVREVVRDAEGAQLSGLNRTVEIPY